MNIRSLLLLIVGLLGSCGSVESSTTSASEQGSTDQALTGMAVRARAKLILNEDGMLIAQGMAARFKSEHLSALTEYELKSVQDSGQNVDNLLIFYVAAGLHKMCESQVIQRVASSQGSCEGNEVEARNNLFSTLQETKLLIPYTAGVDHLASTTDQFEGHTNEAHSSALQKLSAGARDILQKEFSEKHKLFNVPAFCDATSLDAEFGPTCTAK